MSTVKDYIHRFLVTEIKTTKRDFIRVLLIYFAASNAYYLYSPLFSELTGTPAQINLMLFFLDLLMAFSMVFGGFFIRKMREMTAISIWAIVLTITTLVLMNVQSFQLQLFVICVQGIFLGLCVLSFTVYFGDQTKIEEKGRVGGAIVFLSLTFGLILSLFLVTDYAPFLIMMFLGICALAVSISKPEKEKLNNGKATYVDKKNFLLYYIPWLIFCLNNNAFATVTIGRLRQLFPEAVVLIGVIQFFGAALGAIISGCMSDRIGRKLTLMYGLTSLGIAATLVGLTTTIETFIFSYAISGFSWGIFLVLYYLDLWGEFNKGNGWNICYSVGLSTFHFARVFGFLISPFLSKVDVNTASLLSMMLIFSSDIPLIYAQETLPSQYRSSVADLGKYIAKIKRELEKMSKEKK